MKYNVDNNQKMLGEMKHYPAAIKEWSNSVYVFNKSNSNSYNKDITVNRIIKSYFNMDKNSLSMKSKRMRDLIKRSSTRQIFVSKSLIKQTNDKAVISVFIFDRLKKKSSKKLFYLKNDLNFLLNNNTSKKKTKRKQYRKSISRHYINFNTYPKLLNYNFINKKQNLKALFFSYFLRWSLSAFNLKITIMKRGDKLIQGNITRIINNDIFIVYSCKQAKTHIIKDNMSKLLRLDSKEYYKIINIKDKFMINNIISLNDLLYRYLYILLSKCLNQNKLTIKNKIYLLFKFFKNKYYKSFIKKYLRKEYLTFNYLYRLYLNKIKINNLLPGLKYILNNVYNKKIELNIINLKYLHLNSDIFTNAIIVKLRKKTSKLLRVLKKSLKLVKIPRNIETNMEVMKTKVLNVNKSYIAINIKDMYKLLKEPYLHTSKFKDKLNNILNNMFYKPSNQYTIHNDILTSLKYKWITGVRLEAKGRLTKRFTASRSLFKFKYKGNLRNLDYLNKSVNNVSSLYIIRNNLKPNIQYTASNSKKRIGTFGIKGWISNN